MRGGAFEIVLASPVPAGWEKFKPELDGIADRFVYWPEPAPSRLRRGLMLLDPLPIAVASDRSATGMRVISGELATSPALCWPISACGRAVARWSLPSSVVFTHNVEAEIFDRHANVATGIWRVIWRNQARKMAAFEGETLRRFDCVIAVSSRDGAELTKQFGLDRVEAVNTGVDVDFYSFTPPDSIPAPGPAGGTIIFSGAMDTRANIDGVEFMLEEIWPILLRARPGIKALIVGRNPPDSLVAKAKARALAWEFTGYVDDIRDYTRKGRCRRDPSPCRQRHADESL